MSGKKTLAYRFFGLGRLPDTVRLALEAETIWFQEEGIRITATCRREKGRFSFFFSRRKSCSGAVAITSRRLVGHLFSQRMLNIPFHHTCFQYLETNVEHANCLFLRLNGKGFQNGSPGFCEFRFYTPRAEQLFHLLQCVTEQHFHVQSCPESRIA